MQVAAQQAEVQRLVAEWRADIEAVQGAQASAASAGTDHALVRAQEQLQQAAGHVMHLETALGRS